MKFDGETYLHSCLIHNLCDVSKIMENSRNHLLGEIVKIVDLIKTIYGGKIHLNYGDIEQLENGHDKVITFRPKLDSDISIDKIEIGYNSELVDDPKFHYIPGIKISAHFTDDPSCSKIELHMGDSSLNRKASIVIDSNIDSASGIYFIDLSEYIRGTGYWKPTVSYYDKAVLDVVKDFNIPISSDQSSITKIGFEPDEKTILDWPSEYADEYKLIGSTLANGSKEQFINWINGISNTEKKVDTK